ncbi:MAG: thioredoxin-dependent thiol peroxidase [Bacteroidota bacterium]
MTTHLKEGDQAPDFQGTLEDGTAVSLQDYKGKKLVLFFYPKANTPGCTAEACSLRDHYSELQGKGFELLGVSPDSERSQTNFKNKFEFPFHLLADKDRVALEAYGVYGPKKFMGRDTVGVYRTTFVIDENGTIDKIFNKVKTKEHAQQILEAYA